MRAFLGGASSGLAGRALNPAAPTRTTTVATISSFTRLAVIALTTSPVMVPNLLSSRTAKSRSKTATSGANTRSLTTTVCGRGGAPPAGLGACCTLLPAQPATASEIKQMNRRTGLGPNIAATLPYSPSCRTVEQRRRVERLADRRQPGRRSFAPLGPMLPDRTAGGIYRLLCRKFCLLVRGRKQILSGKTVHR